MNHISLFSGIGGAELAAEWAGWTNVAHCEINPFGRRTLDYYWPESESYEDITKTDFSIWRGRCDIITGGFPCQPFSLAGKRQGTEDSRHLWPSMLRVIRQVAPSWVVGENVFGLVNWDGGVVFEQVQVDLEAEGYEVQPFILPAVSVDAPHRRDRVWFVAHAIGSRHGGCAQKTGFDQSIGVGELVTDIGHNGDKIWCETERCGGVTPNTEFCSDRLHPEGRMGMDGSLLEERKGGEETDGLGINGDDEPIANPNIRRLEGSTQIGLDGKYVKRESEFGYASDSGNQGLQGCENNRSIGRSGENRNEQPTGLFPPDWENFPTQSPVCGRNDGLSFRLDSITFPKWRNESIKAYGNAIVPQVAYQIFKAINEYERLNNF